jgi:hypothetical protein
MANFSTYQQAIAPPWLQGPVGARWLAAFGGQKDVHVQRTREAVFARLPTLAPVDAVPYIGDERSIVQGAAESLAAYRQRLVEAWPAWQLAGTAWGILAQLSAQGYSCYIVCANGYVYGPGATLETPPTLVKSGAPWRWSGFPGPFWSVFGLVFDPLPASWTNIVKPPTSSSAPTANEIELICGIVNTWKPAFATFAGILAVQSYPLWGWPRTGPNAAIWGASGRTWGGGVSTLFTC